MHITPIILVCTLLSMHVVGMSFSLNVYAKWTCKYGYFKAYQSDLFIQV